MPFSYSGGMHNFSERIYNFLKVSIFRKCPSFPETVSPIYKLVITTSTKIMKINVSFFKKERNIPKTFCKIYFNYLVHNYTPQYNAPNSQSWGHPKGAHRDYKRTQTSFSNPMESKNEMSAFLYLFLVDAIQEPEEGSY